MATTESTIKQYKTADYGSKQDIRWCIGCGDYSILGQVKKALAETNVDPDKIAWISGIGCSSRFPYYMGTYGLHGIHGRAPALASGLKIARPDMQVWVATGDGDGLSIGGNHMIHTLRRNLDIKIVLFNNKIYGLTKGQASPTTEKGSITSTTPWGSIDPPIAPIALALGCEATFVARAVANNVKHLCDVLNRAAEHKGTAFVEVYQTCLIFNKNAFDSITDKKIRSDHLLELEHGKPMLFGKNMDKGIRLRKNLSPQVVTIGENGVTLDDIVVHDERAETSALAFMLSRMKQPDFPEPIGVFRVAQAPTYEKVVAEQIEDVKKKTGPADLQKLLTGSDTWTVE
jgi:2-oxoglutarate/2-oxoacid ferredoxin oxidoreductase subunit beta